MKRDKIHQLLMAGLVSASGTGLSTEAFLQRQKAVGCGTACEDSSAFREDGRHEEGMAGGMKPYDHARSSARRFGGVPEDYLRIHDWFDQTKMAHPDMRHRAILHNAFGCYLAEQFFGHNLVNSDGKLVSVRDIAEKHVLEDMGRIPTLSDYLNGMPMYPWLGGKKKTKSVHITLDEPRAVGILD